MKKTFTALMTALTLSIGATNLSAEEACTTQSITDDASNAVAAGYTESTDMSGAEASRYLEAFARVVGADVATLPQVDQIVLRTNPERTAVFIVLFYKSCFVLGGRLEENTIIEIGKMLETMKADNHG